MKYLVTGAAGFIGHAICSSLLAQGHQVTGLDNLNHYYNVRLKQDRLADLGISLPLKDNINRLESHTYPDLFSFIQMDLQKKQEILQLFESSGFHRVIHLAAQAGVRYSIQNPQAYLDSNVTGFLSILEACRHYPIEHLIYASSSSVYGRNNKIPFQETDATDQPASLYAASKKANELMASTYQHLYNIHCTGLRFFTVYGPWGRPDMAPILFSQAILQGKPIQVFNHGNMQRDFTYIDDIVQGVLQAADLPVSPQSMVYNIGRGEPVNLMEFISILEKLLNRKAILQMQEMQPGDVPVTWADTSALQQATGYRPHTSLQSGLEQFTQWIEHYPSFNTL